MREGCVAGRGWKANVQGLQYRENGDILISDYRYFKIPRIGKAALPRPKVTARL
jgi:hypothetical protein